MVYISGIKQAIVNKSFLISVLACIFIFFSSCFDGILGLFNNGTDISSNFRYELILTALKSEAMIFALPIVCTLPFTTSFVDDIKSGYIKLYLHRSTKNHYVISKIISCILSGGLSLVIGILISYIILSLSFVPIEILPSESEVTYAYILEFTERTLLYFFSGMFWSLIGLLFSTLVKSRYMAYSAPFIIYYVLIILVERYFKNLYSFYPKEWLIPSDKWNIGRIAVVILVSELLLLVSVIFFCVAKRRISSL